MTKLHLVLGLIGERLPENSLTMPPLTDEDEATIYNELSNTTKGYLENLDIESFQQDNNDREGNDEEVQALTELTNLTLQYVYRNLIQNPKTPEQVAWVQKLKDEQQAAHDAQEAKAQLNRERNRVLVAFADQLLEQERYQAAKAEQKLKD